MKLSFTHLAHGSTGHHRAAAPLDARADSAGSENGDAFAPHAGRLPHVPDMRLLGAVVGDATVCETRAYEGGGLAQSATYLGACLKDIGTGRFIDLQHGQRRIAALRARLAQYETLAATLEKLLRSWFPRGVLAARHAIAQATADALCKLQPNQALLVPFGFHGHAILSDWRIPAEAPACFDITLYNSGAGKDYHGQWLDAQGAKERHDGALALHRVPRDRILAGRRPTAGLQAWFEPMVHAAFSRQVRFSRSLEECAVYDVLLPALQEGPLDATTPLPPAAATSGQRAGTCAWRSLLLMARHQLADIYKSVRFEIQAATLLGFLRRHGSLTAPQTVIAREAIANLQDAALKLAEGSIDLQALRAALAPHEARTQRETRPLGLPDPQAPESLAGARSVPGHQFIARSAPWRLPRGPRAGACAASPCFAPVTTAAALKTLLGESGTYCAAQLRAKRYSHVRHAVRQTTRALPPTGAPAWAGMAPRQGVQQLYALISALLASCPAHYSEYNDAGPLAALATLATHLGQLAQRCPGAHLTAFRLDVAPLLDDLLARDDVHTPVRDYLMWRACDAGMPATDLPVYTPTCAIEPWGDEYLQLRRVAPGCLPAVYADTLWQRHALARVATDLGQGALHGDARAFAAYRGAFLLLKALGTRHFPQQSRSGRVPKLTARLESPELVVHLSAFTKHVAACRRLRPRLSVEPSRIENSILLEFARFGGGAFNYVRRQSSDMPRLHMWTALMYAETHLAELRQPENLRKLLTEALLCTKVGVPGRDWSLHAQTQEPLLHDELRREPLFGLRLTQFLERARQLFSGPLRDQTALLYVCELAYQLRAHSRAAGAEINIYDAEAALRELAAEDAEDAALAQTAATYLRCVSLDATKRLDDATLCEAARMMLVYRSVTAQELTGSLLDNTRFGIAALSEPLRQACARGEFVRQLGLVLNRQLAAWGTSGPAAWKIDFPHLHAGSFSFDLASGRMLWNDLPFIVGLLPHSKHAVAVFGHTMPRAICSGERFYRVPHTPPAHAHDFEAGRVDMQFTVDGVQGWFKHTFHPGPLWAGLVQGRLIFRACAAQGPRYLLVHPSSHAVEAVAQRQGTRLHIVSQRRDTLGLVAEQPTHLDAALAQFEIPDEICFWRDSAAGGRLVRIDLWRHGLSFEVDAEGRPHLHSDARLVLSRQPGEHFPQVPTLRLHSAEGGEQHVLLSRYALKTDALGRIVVKGAPLARELPRGRLKCDPAMLCQEQSDGTLRSEDKDVAAEIGARYAEVRDYERAVAVLRFGQACNLQLPSASAMGELLHLAEAPPAFKAICALAGGSMDRYLAVLHNVPLALRLTPEEELLRLRARKLSPYLAQRLAYLRGHRVDQVPLAALPQPQSEPPRPVSPVEAAAGQGPSRGSEAARLPVWLLMLPSSAQASAIFVRCLRVALGDDAAARAELERRLSYFCFSARAAEPEATVVIKRLAAALHNPQLARTLLGDFVAAPHNLKKEPTARAFACALRKFDQALAREPAAAPGPQPPVAAELAPPPFPPKRVRPAMGPPLDAAETAFMGAARRYLTRPQAAAPAAPWARLPHDLTPSNHRDAALYNEQLAALAGHLATYRAPVPTRLTAVNLGALREALLALLPTDLQAQGDALCATANQMYAQDAEALRETVARHGRQRARIALEHILHAVPDRDCRELRRRNPTLPAHVQEALLDGALTYLVAATQQQQVQRCLNLTDAAAAQADGVARLATLHTLHASLCARRHYDVSVLPELLFFEYSRDCLLRHEQVAALHALLRDDAAGDGEAVALQLPMGFGKTFLLPLLAKRRATGERLPVAVLPAPLLATQHAEMHRASMRAFGQGSARFEFDRKVATSADELRKRIELFDDSMHYQSYLVATRRSLLSLRLSHTEALLNLAAAPAPTSEAIEKAALLTQLVQRWRDRAHVMLDEIDQACDMAQEVNYAVGQRKPVAPELRGVVVDMYRILLGADWRHCVRLQDNHQSLLDPATYRALCAEVAEDFLQREAQQVPSAQRALLRDYVLGSDAAQCRAYVDALYGEAANLLAQKVVLLRQQLNEILRLTLRRHGGEHYGRDLTPGSHAIPFERGAPKLGCEFSSPYETLNYTIQSYCHAAPGITAADIWNGLEGLRPEISAGIQETSDAFEELEAVRFLRRLCAGLDLQPLQLLRATNAQTADVQALARACAADPLRGLLFVERCVLPKVRSYRQQLCGTSLDLACVGRTTQGFTGTLYNASTLHPRFAASVPDETDGITQTIFIDPHKTRLAAAPDTSAVGLLLAAATTRDASTFRALIDTGALLRGQSEVAVAEALRQHFMAQAHSPIEHLLFFQKDQLLVWACREGAQPQAIESAEPRILRAQQLRPETTFTYYDQAHATGSNLPQAADAAAVVTIGELTTWRDVQQGALRMRQLALHQACTLVLPEALSAQPLTLGHIMDHCLRQQTQALSRTRLQYLHKIVLCQARDAVLAAGLQLPVKEAAELYAVGRGLWIDSFAKDPYREFALGKQMPVRRVVQQALEETFAAMDAIAQASDALPQPVAQQLRRDFAALRRNADVEAMIRQVGAVPAEVYHNPRASDTQVERERETEVEQRVLAERDVQPPDLKPLDNTPIDPTALAMAPFAECIEPLDLRRLDSLPQLEGLDANLWATCDARRTLEGEPCAYLSAGQKPVQFMLLVGNRRGDADTADIAGEVSAYVILSAEEAELAMYTVGRKPAAQVPVAVCDLNGHCVRRGTPCIDLACLRTPQHARVMMQLKVLDRFFSKELILTADQRQAMELWLSEGDEGLRQRRARLGHGPSSRGDKRELSYRHITIPAAIIKPQ